MRLLPHQAQRLPNNALVIIEEKAKDIDAFVRLYRQSKSRSTRLRRITVLERVNGIITGRAEKLWLTSISRHQKAL